MAKKMYLVTRTIVVEHYHEVEATSKKEAIEIAEEYGEATNAGCSYVGDRDCSKAVIIRPEMEYIAANFGMTTSEYVVFAKKGAE